MMIPTNLDGFARVCPGDLTLWYDHPGEGGTVAFGHVAPYWPVLDSYGEKWLVLPARNLEDAREQFALFWARRHPRQKWLDAFVVSVRRRHHAFSLTGDAVVHGPQR